MLKIFIILNQAYYILTKHSKKSYTIKISHFPTFINNIDQLLLIEMNGNAARAFLKMTEFQLYMVQEG